MKTIYEAPVAEVIDFAAKEKLAVVPEPDETVGRDPSVEIGSKNF